MRDTVLNIFESQVGTYVSHEENALIDFCINPKTPYKPFNVSFYGCFDPYWNYFTDAKKFCFFFPFMLPWTGKVVEEINSKVKNFQIKILAEIKWKLGTIPGQSGWGSNRCSVTRTEDDKFNLVGYVFHIEFNDDYPDKFKKYAIYEIHHTLRMLSVTEKFFNLHTEDPGKDYLKKVIDQNNSVRERMGYRALSVYPIEEGGWLNLDNLAVINRINFRGIVKQSEILEAVSCDILDYTEYIGRLFIHNNYVKYIESVHNDTVVIRYTGIMSDPKTDKLKEPDSVYRGTEHKKGINLRTIKFLDDVDIPEEQLRLISKFLILAEIDRHLSYRGEDISTKYPVKRIRVTYKKYMVAIRMYAGDRYPYYLTDYGRALLNSIKTYEENNKDTHRKYDPYDLVCGSIVEWKRAETAQNYVELIIKYFNKPAEVFTSKYEQEEWV